jgi:hypothetical protein
MKTHWSDCALHNLPAHRPERCDCGGHSGTGGPISDFYQLLIARWQWKCEMAIGWAEFLDGLVPRRIVYAVLVTSLVGAITVISGCTMIRYTDGQKSLTIADLRISGSAIDLKGTLANVGTIEVNREQGSVGEAVSEVVEVLP